MQDNQESYSVYCLPPKRDYPELSPNFSRTSSDALPMFFRRFTAIITDMITVITDTITDITVTHYKMGFPFLQIGFLW